jgi:hypothetical protein
MTRLKDERDALSKDRTKAGELLDEPLLPDAENAAQLRLRLGIC